MNITLIGMPGVGKSTLGKQLAKTLNYEFIDIDEIIEKKTNLKLQQIIDKLGEDKFIKIEEKSILELGEIDKCVISTGGSAIYSGKAMDFLKKRTVIIFLSASLNDIQKRVPDFSTRGTIGLRKKNLKSLFDERLNFYRKYSDISIEVPRDFNIQTIIKTIIKKINKLRK